MRVPTRVEKPLKIPHFSQGLLKKGPSENIEGLLEKKGELDSPN